MIYYHEWFWRQKYQHHLSFDTMHSFDSGGGGSKGSWVWLKGVMCSPTRLPLAFIFSLRGTFWRIFFSSYVLIFFSLCGFMCIFFGHFKSNSSIVVSMVIRYFSVNAKLFTNIRLFTVYEVNRANWTWNMLHYCHVVHYLVVPYPS